MWPGFIADLFPCFAMFCISKVWEKSRVSRLSQVQNLGEEVMELSKTKWS